VPWQDGPHDFIYYVKDKPWYFVRGTVDDAGRMTVENLNPDAARRLPKKLRGISRYMMLQTINGVVVEASPRHTLPRERVIEDYQRIKPGWVPTNIYTQEKGVPEIYKMAGQIMTRVKKDPYGMTGWVWDNDETTEVPL